MILTPVSAVPVVSDIPDDIKTKLSAESADNILQDDRVLTLEQDLTALS